MQNMCNLAKSSREYSCSPADLQCIIFLVFFRFVDRLFNSVSKRIKKVHVVRIASC